MARWPSTRLPSVGDRVDLRKRPRVWKTLRYDDTAWSQARVLWRESGWPGPQARGSSIPRVASHSESGCSPRRHGCWQVTPRLRLGWGLYVVYSRFAYEFRDLTASHLEDQTTSELTAPWLYSYDVIFRATNIQELTRISYAHPF